MSEEISNDDAGELLGLRGQLIDSPTFGWLRTWRDGGIIVDPASGTIVEVGDYGPLFRQRRTQTVRWVDLPTNAVICPGLVDVHAHLPQYPASGCGQGELLPWLRDHIFPLEREFNARRARVEAPRFFHELARHGTTTAMLYTAIYDESCEAAFACAEQQRPAAHAGQDDDGCRLLRRHAGGADRVRLAGAERTAVPPLARGRITGCWLTRSVPGSR